MLCDRLLFCLPHKTLDEGENIVVHWSWHSRTRDFNAWYPRCTHTRAYCNFGAVFEEWLDRPNFVTSSVISLDPQIPYTPFDTFKRLYEEHDFFHHFCPEWPYVFSIYFHTAWKVPYSSHFATYFSRLFKHYARILHFKKWEFTGDFQPLW